MSGDWPPVWVLIATYKRTEVSLRAIENNLKFLDYPNLHYHIADDGSGETDDGTHRWHVGVLAEAIGGDVTWHEMDTPEGQFNTGGNINRGIEIAQQNGCSIYLVICDDDMLVEPWDIRPHVDLLDTHPAVGALRCAHLSEGQGVLIQSFVTERVQKRYLWGRIIRDWSINNPWETQTYLAIFDTIIFHQRFFDAYGKMVEHQHPGITECELCKAYNYSPLGEDGPQVMLPLGPNPGSPWKHISKRAHYYRALTERD